LVDLRALSGLRGRCGGGGFDGFGGAEGAGRGSLEALVEVLVFFGEAWWRGRGKWGGGVGAEGGGDKAAGINGGDEARRRTHCLEGRGGRVI